jgi:tetratricopeptide (TPR) repeat protein
MQMGIISSGEAIIEINKNLDKTIELDPDYPGSHYTNAIIGVWTEWNWEKGEKEFLKALAINPSDVYSRIYYSHLLMILQRSDEALTQGQLAVDLDPMNSLILALYVVVLGDAHDYQAAYTYAEKAVAVDPENGFAFHRLRCASYDFGKYDKAFECYKKENELTEEVNNSIDRIFKEQGRFAAYEEIVNQLELLSQNGYVAFWEPAYRYHQINQYEKALDWIEKGFERHNPNMPYIATGATNLNQLYNHPRFIAILEKMNLPLPKQ